MLFVINSYKKNVTSMGEFQYVFICILHINEMSPIIYAMLNVNIPLPKYKYLFVWCSCPINIKVES